MKLGRAARGIDLSGVFAAAVTPNRPGTLDADYSGFMDLLDFLAAAGVQGICVLGSTGEFLNYPFSDRQRLVYLGVKRSRIPLIAGVGHSTLRGALEIAGEAIAAGADALLLMPPYFYDYGQAEIEEFYRVFASETGDAVPIVLYNIPAVTSPLAIETVGRLMATGRFAGIKDSGGDIGYFRQLTELRRDHPFALLAGHDRIALDALQAGADGVISGCASAVPEVLAGLYKAHTAGDSQAAGQWNLRLQEFVTRIEQFPAPIAIKRAVAIRGQKAGEAAVPLAAETAAALAEFETWFRGWLK